MPGLATPDMAEAMAVAPDEDGWDVADSGATTADRAVARNGNGHAIVLTPLDEETTIQDEDPLAPLSTDAVTLPRRRPPPPRAPPSMARPAAPASDAPMTHEDETRKGPAPSSGPPPAHSGVNGRGKGAANGNASTGVAVAPLDWSDQESDSQTEIYVKEKRLPRAVAPPRAVPAPRATEKSLSWLPPPTPPPPSTGARFPGGASTDPRSPGGTSTGARSPGGASTGARSPGGASTGTLPWPARAPAPMSSGLGATHPDNPAGSLPPARTPPLGETRNDKPSGSLPPPRTPPRSNPPPSRTTALGPLPRPSMPAPRSYEGASDVGHAYRSDPTHAAPPSPVASSSNGLGGDYARQDAYPYESVIPAAARMPSLSPADWGLAAPAPGAYAPSASAQGAYGFDYRGRAAPGAPEPPGYAGLENGYAGAAPDPYAAAQLGAFPSAPAPVPMSVPPAAYAPPYAPPPAARPAAAAAPPKERGPWNRQSLALAAASLVLSVLMAVVLLVPRRGQLRIDAAVEGGGRLERAEVYVDGRKECDTVPCTVTNLAPGPKTIKLMAPDGAAPELVIETVERGQEKAVVIPVRGGRGVGGTRLVVAPGQPGLKVTVDGADRGPAPIDLHVIAPGPHRVRFDAGPRFEPLESTVEVPAGQTLEIAAVNLKVLRGRATIDLLTPGARVILARVDTPSNAKLLPGPWPMALDLDPGWKVSASLRGFRSFEQPVTFTDGAPETSVRVELQPEGAIVAQAAPAAQAPYVPRAAAAAPATPRVGNYQQQADDDDDEPAASEPASTGGGGTLNINSLPLSKVLLDGKPLGSTPKVGVKVTAGSHTVTFIHPELGRKSLSVSVKPGQTATASVRFNK
ncbi:MAG: PEGA domain-containing protein [Polyangiaceae bacterium]